MKTVSTTLLLATMVSGGLWPVPSLAFDISWTGQPETYTIRMENAELQGFGPWQFGMSPSQVEQRLVAQFPGAPIRASEDPVQRTQSLSIDLPDLSPVEGSPSPAPATVTFIFGYRSGTLMTINLNWFAPGEATESQRQALIDAGSAYVAEMLGYYWAPMNSARGHVIGPNRLILFSGLDDRDRGVEVRVEGIALDIIVPGEAPLHQPVAGGPAQLHIGLSLQPDDPDVYRVPDNAF